MPPLRPVDPRRLAWLRVEGVAEGAQDLARERLAPCLARGGLAPVYEAKRRAIYRVDDPLLGSVALKEVRSGSWLRALLFRRFLPHPALRELRAGAAFAARGGATAGLLAAALERDPLRLLRVFLCLRWVERAQSLGVFLRGLGSEPDAEALGPIAGALLAAARLGLVHGRHSGDNLLVTLASGRLEIRVIDFAHASLGAGFEPEGFARDAGRVAAGLVILGHASQATAMRLLGLLEADWPDPASAVRAREWLDAAFARSLAEGPPKGQRALPGPRAR